MKWLVLWSLWAARLVRQPTVTLQLTNGPVRGVISPDGSLAQYFAIPYATVTQRFQGPGPEPTWTDVYDAVNENVRCIQSLGDKWMVGTRNCLILNIHTPLNAANSKLPVMVFFHGGAFCKGSGSSFILGPNYLVSKGVILVTINYRLDIHGFLCLGIKEAPGNAAMKDQVAALRWVKKNIRKFGGDPDNVTIFGESAGAASVSFHLNSHMSKGLFHKAIMQSGSSLGAWAFQYRPVFLASLLAKAMLYDSQDPYDLYKYFMSKSDNDLLLTRVPRKEGQTIISEVLYTPCVEKVIEGIEPFLTEPPFDVLSRGDYTKVPVMLGFNNEEGLLIIAFDSETKINQINFEKALPKNLHVPVEKDRLKIAKELKRLYMDENETNVEPLEVKLSRYIGDVDLIYPSLQETEWFLKTNEHPVYNYIFQYAGRRNIAKSLMRSSFKEVEGATHADDLFYLFSQTIVPTLFENEIIEKMSTMWTNFAKYGDPTPDFTKPTFKWHRTNSSLPTSLVIDKEFKTSPLWLNERVKYLKEVYSKFRRKR